ncbi:MAG: tetratricopeptide repeat protein [Bacteroidales bacterium]|nr:tetratricopeptide repeat protein [Bacteroidales bacterium]
MNKRFVPALVAALIGTAAPAQSLQFHQGLDLYQRGMYSQAARIFDSMDDELSAGYSVLCGIAMKAEGYEVPAQAYLDKWPESVLASQIEFQWGLDLFDQERFEEASAHFDRLSQSDLRKDQAAEFAYKKAYSLFGCGEYDRAETQFARAADLPYSDYTAPARYSLGYLAYSRGDFREASEQFLQAAKDPRFTELANYYILECRFMEKDYEYVVKFGEDLFDKVPEDRQPHMARIMSESYLVLGDKQKARSYYQKNLQNKAAKTRADWFYAGSVLYSVGDWQGAIDNYAQMPERTDSLGQIAGYQMGYSYIQTRNKVAAMEAFRDAADLDYDLEIKEDAFFNYAKLAFDLNNDTSAFDEYMTRYDARSKGDQIYSYMAMAALARHDYEGAVAAYDHIDELDPRMQSNYMKAYFLRAEQLIGSGAWRDAVPHLKTAAYYSTRRDPFNQLSRYWMAEASFRDEKYQDARTTLLDLYNLSALDGKPEGDLIPYNIAYTYFKEGDYGNALKWFDHYLEGRHDACGADAETRIGDCYFFRKDYTTAIAAYERKLTDYPDADDIYPYFRAGVASGLVRDFGRKVEFLERVKQAAPSSPWWSEAMYELGRAYVSAGEEDDAVRTFKNLRSATDDRSYAARALLELGMIARNKGDDDTALACYKQVVGEGSDYSEDALLAIESIYQTRQEPDAYLAYVNGLGGRDVRTEEQKETVYFGTAEQIFLSGNWSKAVTTLQSYLEKYPEGTYKAKAEFYLAESYRMTDAREKACDFYVKAIEDRLDGSFEEQAWLRYADLSYALGQYGKAYNAYQTLLGKAQLGDNQFAARLGMMRSAFRAREFEDALQTAETFRKDRRATEDQVREADYIMAKSCLGTSRRERAFQLLAALAKEPSTDEGAEAAYLVIQDQYDRADFDGIEEKVYAFSSKASGQNYWLAKAFIVLGDTFAENGNMAQAKATFESIRDGYTSTGASDEVLEQVGLRLDKLSK